MLPPSPPPLRTALQNHPTLLVSWWATGFALAIIAVRVSGRYLRLETLFLDDAVMLLSIVPLLARMALVHLVLLWGTNNLPQDAALALAPQLLRQRQLGSGLVLAARICYALFVWTAKLTVCLFLRRIAAGGGLLLWGRSAGRLLRAIYWVLALTLFVVVVATLAECHPFAHYWQVVPDPGPRCRLGYANLLAMGVCSVLCDLLLVAFPIPLVVLARHNASMPPRRKLALVLLFALSLLLVAIAGYRVPAVVARHGSQQFRSLLASFDVLAAAAVANAVAIGSFLRDRGAKKIRFKKAVASAAVGENIDYASLRRTTVTYHQWGSDSDLAVDLGFRLKPELCYCPPPPPQQHQHKRLSVTTTEDDVSAADSIDVKITPHEYLETNGASQRCRAERARARARSPQGRLSVFDIGGLLDPAQPAAAAHRPIFRDPFRRDPLSAASTRERRTLLHDVGGLLSSQQHQEAAGVQPPPKPPDPVPKPPDAVPQAFIAGSTRVVELRDVGGLLREAG